MESARLLTTKNQTVYFRQFDMRTFNRFEGIFSVENVAIDRVIEGGGGGAKLGNLIRLKFSIP